MRAVTVTVTRKALGTRIREALEAARLPVDVFVDETVGGALRYRINGTAYSPGDAATLLGIDLDGHFSTQRG